MVPVSRPQQLPTEQLNSLWQSICNCTLTNTPSSLAEVHLHITGIINLIVTSFESGTSQPLLNILSEHQIPKQLYLLSLADIPQGLINEAVHFYSAFCVPPCSSLLAEPYIIEPFNLLIENPQRADLSSFGNLIEKLLKHITHEPARLRLFFI